MEDDFAKNGEEKCCSRPDRRAYWARTSNNCRRKRNPGLSCVSNSSSRIRNPGLACLRVSNSCSGVSKSRRVVSILYSESFFDQTPNNHGSSGARRTGPVASPGVCGRRKAAFISQKAGKNGTIPAFWEINITGPITDWLESDVCFQPGDFCLHIRRLREKSQICSSDDRSG